MLHSHALHSCLSIPCRCSGYEYFQETHIRDDETVNLLVWWEHMDKARCVGQISIFVLTPGRNEIELGHYTTSLQYQLMIEKYYSRSTACIAPLSKESMQCDGPCSLQNFRNASTCECYQPLGVALLVLCYFGKQTSLCYHGTGRRSRSVSSVVLTTTGNADRAQVPEEGFHFQRLHTQANASRKAFLNHIETAIGIMTHYACSSFRKFSS